MVRPATAGGVPVREHEREPPSGLRRPIERLPIDPPDAQLQCFRVLPSLVPDPAGSPYRNKACAVSGHSTRHPVLETERLPQWPAACTQSREPASEVANLQAECRPVRFVPKPDATVPQTCE